MLALLIPWPVLGKNTGFPREELKLERVFITVLFVDIMRAQHLPCPKYLLGLSRKYWSPCHFSSLDWTILVLCLSKKVKVLQKCGYVCLRVWPCVSYTLSGCKVSLQSIFSFVREDSWEEEEDLR